MSDYAATFANAYPRAVDFTKTEYDANEAEMTSIAQASGYRLAGFRLGFAVFTSKGVDGAARSNKPQVAVNPQGDALGK